MIQQTLIRFLLAPLAKWMHMLSEKTRERLFAGAGIGLFCVFFLYSGRVITWRYLYTFAICCILTGVMLLASLPEKISPVKFHFLLIPMLGVGIMTALSGVRNNVDYLPEAMLFLVAYPVIYICWNNTDREKLIRQLIRIVRTSFVIFLTASLLLIQISSRRYAGLFWNFNNGAFYLSLVCGCLAAEIIYSEKFDKRCAADILLFGACQAMNSYTNSRTGQLAVYVAVGMCVLIFLFTNGKKEKIQILKRGICCVLVSIVLTSSLIYVFQARQLVPIPYYAKTSRSFYFTERWGIDLGNGTQNPDDPLNEQESVQDEIFGTDSYKDFNSEKNNAEGKTLDGYSSGRLSIWKKYGSELNLFGHAQIPTLVMVTETGYRSEIRSTHMTILEIAYESGLIAGLFYLTLNILSGILAIRFALKRRQEKYALFPLMIILVFGVCSAFTAICGSFAYITTLYYYLAMFPLMVKERSQNISDGASV